MALEDRPDRHATGLGQIDIAVIKLPRISNYDDFLALEHEDGVTVRFVEEPREMAGTDLAIIPGSKSTIADLGWLHESGFARAIVDRAREGGLIAGICGGCQMLGEGIEDPHRVESDEASARGLGLLPIVTRFAKTKLTAQVHARVKSCSILSGADLVADEISAYEIHMGNVERTAGSSAPFRIVSRNGARGRNAGRRDKPRRHGRRHHASRNFRKRRVAARPFSARCAGVKGSPRMVKRGLSPRARPNTIASPRRSRIASICRCYEK